MAIFHFSATNYIRSITWTKVSSLIQWTPSVYWLIQPIVVINCKGNCYFHSQKQSWAKNGSNLVGAVLIKFLNWNKSCLWILINKLLLIEWAQRYHYFFQSHNNKPSFWTLVILNCRIILFLFVNLIDN